MDAEDVDLSTRVAEECTQAAGHEGEGLFACSAVGTPIVVGDDEEQMVCVG
jgi:hypothetical protein